MIICCQNAHMLPVQWQWALSKLYLPQIGPILHRLYSWTLQESISPSALTADTQTRRADPLINPIESMGTATPPADSSHPVVAPEESSRCNESLDNHAAPPPQSQPPPTMCRVPFTKLRMGRGGWGHFRPYNRSSIHGSCPLAP